MNYFIACIRNSYFYRHLLERLHIFYYKKKKYGHKKILDSTQANIFLKEMILSHEPFFVTRLGGNECEIIRQYLEIRHHIRKHYTSDIIKTSKTGAGIFPNNEFILSKVAELYLKEIKNVTCFGVWYLPMEDYIISHFSKPTKLIQFYSLYPVINDWTTALQDFRVLIIHPFEKSIIKQYEIRHKILNNNKLPSFDLITYKPIVSLAEENVGFNNWFEALEKMKKDVSSLIFDIALVGCGAYGLPLSSYIYNEMHKKVIHVGGSLQLLFGIKGSAYLKNKEVLKEVNDFWVFPLEEETPKNSKLVENSCYWK